MESAQRLSETQPFVLSLAVLLAVFGLYVVKRYFSHDLVDNLHEKYVVITGCDSGFGKAFALQLDRLGFNVFATCLTTEGEDELRLLCSKRLRTIRLDVRNSEEIAQAVKQVHSTLPAGKGKLNRAMSPRMAPSVLGFC